MAKTEDSAPLLQTARRERRVRRKRQEIVDAAARLFADKGFEATTNKDIASALDVGESTLYGYFASKDDLFRAVLARQGETVDALLAQLPELKGRQSIVELVDVVMEKLLAHPADTRLAIAEALGDDEEARTFVQTHWKPIVTTLRDFMTMRTASGKMRAVDPQLAARMIIGTFVGAILPVLQGNAPVPTPEERHRLAATVVAFLSGAQN